ncbi:MAG: hypothetical protein ACXABY_09270 [Candidatus Thorarchaeota archaeon]|jgi:hypothetical protein
MEATFDFIIDDSVDNAKSEAVQIPQWAKGASLYIPSIQDTILSMEMMESRNATTAKLLSSNDTDWIQVRDEGESAQIAASGIESCWIVISEFIKALPKDCYIRFVSAVDQLVDKSFAITFRS